MFSLAYIGAQAMKVYVPNINIHNINLLIIINVLIGKSSIGAQAMKEYVPPTKSMVLNWFKNHLSKIFTKAATETLVSGL